MLLRPFKLKKKAGNIKLSDLEPSDLSPDSTDFTKSKCCGALFGQGVLVTHPHHIWSLVRVGCYGKGIFSRSVPCHHHIPSSSELRQASRKRKNSGAGNEEVELTWKKRIRLHSQWKEEQEDIIDNGKKKPSSSPVQDRECAAQSEIKDGAEHEEFVKRLKAIKRDDPYKMEEYLQLGVEEAFYLVAEAKILSVTTTEDAQLTEHELWTHFSQSNQRFCVRYAAYRHYRRGNWVPKSGLKFGVDFLLYKEGPLYHHSSFAVMVRETADSHRDKMTWREIVSWSRANEAVGKELVICHVTRSSDAAVDKWVEPSCIETMSIKDVIIKRWIPDKDREASDT